MGTAKDSPSDWEEWKAELRNRPLLVKLTAEEWAKRFEGADPPTEDDVPFRFPVKVEIREHADELAERFKRHEPGEGVECPVEEYLLERAALGRARSERQVIDAVVAARAAGASRQKIGALLGTSGQAAQQRYGSLVEPA